MGKEKKEIGIEKLIELLNEYAKVLRIGDYVGWHNKETVENSDYIFTKKFGFIKWLVENEKINFNGLPNIFTSIYAEKRDDIYYEIKRNNYSVLTEQYGVNLTDRLLMLLSISDTPIEDLISYLK